MPNNEQVEQMMRLLAAVVMQAGGEIRVPCKTADSFSRKHMLHSELDPTTQEIVITVKEKEERKIVLPGEN